MRTHSALWLLLASGAAACESASPLSPVTSLLRVEGAQPVPGPPPVDAAGPGVRGISLLSATVWPGQQRKPLAGTLDAGATAVSVYLVGDRSHYILPAGPPDVTAPELPTFAAALSFSPQLDPGPRALQVQATGSDGRYGAPLLQSLAVAGDPLPQGALVFTLRWERAADLDLHVEEPGGAEIWARRKGATRTSAGSADASAGYLDADSNPQCVLDGRQRESVIYPSAAPAGWYRVRVDTFSLCGQATAYWQVEARAHGQVLATARGQSLPTSMRGPHGQGAGVLALEVEPP